MGPWNFFRNGAIREVPTIATPHIKSSDDAVYARQSR